MQNCSDKRAKMRCSPLHLPIEEYEVAIRPRDQRRKGERILSHLAETI